MSKHHIIYIPGIGDHKPYYQPQIINFWKIFGVQPHYHPVIWRSQDEGWDEKLNKLSKLIEELSSTGNVSLVGVSAGASAALNAYMANQAKINNVIFVCGKLRNPQTIGAPYYKRNPSFKESLHMAQKSIEKMTANDSARMLSLQPLYDETVPVADTKLPGVRNWRMLGLWHVPSIFVGITLYAPIICAFAKRETNE